jgi:hypothetical protein
VSVCSRFVILFGRTARPEPSTLLLPTLAALQSASSKLWINLESAFTMKTKLLSALKIRRGNESIRVNTQTAMGISTHGQARLRVSRFQSGIVNKKVGKDGGKTGTGYSIPEFSGELRLAYAS